MFVHVAADILFQIWSYTLLKAEKKEKKRGSQYLWLRSNQQSRSQNNLTGRERDKKTEREQRNQTHSLL